jgi:polysaccharide pyruvyl transferase WcaK-like protein
MPFAETQYPVLIRGGFGYGNFGDDMLMIAAHELTARSVDPEKVAFLVHQDGYLDTLLPHIRTLPAARTNRIATRRLVYGGGTQFYSFRRTRFRRLPRGSAILKALAGPRSFAKKVRSRFAKHHYTTDVEEYDKVAAIGIGIGPFVENSIEERRAKEIFREMDFVAVRDPASLQWCNRWGVKRVVLRADLTFLPDCWERLQCRMAHRSDGTVQNVGLVVRDWPHSSLGDAYAGNLMVGARKLRQAGFTCDFVCFAKRTDTSFLDRLTKERENVISWNPPHDSVASFLSKLSHFDAFVTARYHGAIFAAMLRKPVVCINLEPKLELVAQLLGDGARLWNPPFKPAGLLESLRDLQKHHARAVRALDDVVSEQRKLARQMADEYHQFLQEG